jgi:hypothetical protein
MKITHDNKEITISFDEFTFSFKIYENLELYKSFLEMSDSVKNRNEYELELNENQSISVVNTNLDDVSYTYSLKFETKINSVNVDFRSEYKIKIDKIGQDILSKKLLYIHDILEKFEPQLKKQTYGNNFIFTIF